MFETGTPDCEAGVQFTSCELQYKEEGKRRRRSRIRIEEEKYIINVIIVPIFSHYFRPMAQQRLGG
jgi:hypothetical protein